MLEVRSVGKRFGGLQAIQDASFTVEKGSITGLIGPNGAGKTTLFSIVSGSFSPTTGQVFFEGQDITGFPAHVLARRGIGRTFQIVKPFAGLSIIENVTVGAFLRHHNRSKAEKVARDVARRVGLTGDLDRPASDLTVAGRKRLEVAKALATEPRLLLLDEVLAGLNPSEIRDIIPVIRALRDDGVTILMIEHVMQAVVSLCDRVHVLAQGRIVAAGTPAEVVADPAVIEAYLGQGAAARLNPVRSAAHA
ncbi:ABC transporter ATP-binding protein [Aureimonas ureilytica]|uniref:ABC transporter ATP-binding protein n=1 Tax=Aureimonas ureilytica TaxID=401562 RepID=UPI00037A0F01|nr:ABC transporter ATP-binding protein [Aureimonas ureilytica]